MDWDSWGLMGFFAEVIRATETTWTSSLHRTDRCTYILSICNERDYGCCLAGSPWKILSVLRWWCRWCYEYDDDGDLCWRRGWYDGVANNNDTTRSLIWYWNAAFKLYFDSTDREILGRAARRAVGCIGSRFTVVAANLCNVMQRSVGLAFFFFPVLLFSNRHLPCTLQGVSLRIECLICFSLWTDTWNIVVVMGNFSQSAGPSYTHITYIKTTITTTENHVHRLLLFGFNIRIE